jgi:hypothetical protein
MRRLDQAMSHTWHVMISAVISEFLGAAGCGDSAIGRDKVPPTRGLQ